MSRIPSLLTRTPGRPFVSVLIPTRTRPESRLEETVSNCLANASRPEDVEICIKVDRDDQQALDLSQRLRDESCGEPFQIHQMERGQGYADLPRYINHLAANAKGDWLWLLGDNAWPVTKNWDLAIEQWFPPTATYIGCQDVCLFSPTFTVEAGFHIPISPVPFVRRKMYDILGHVTLLPCWDMWLNSVAYMSGILMTVPIQVEHCPSGSRTDLDEEVINRINGKRFTTAIRRQMVVDATKIVNYLEALDKQAKWQPHPEWDGFYFWKSPHGFLLLMLCENGQVFMNEQQKKLFIPGGDWLPVGEHGELLR